MKQQTTSKYQKIELPKAKGLTKALSFGRDIKKNGTIEGVVVGIKTFTNRFGNSGCVCELKDGKSVFVPSGLNKLFKIGKVKKNSQIKVIYKGKDNNQHVFELFVA